MWAEHHMAVGASLYGLSSINGEPSSIALAAASLLAVASHRELDS